MIFQKASSLSCDGSVSAAGESATDETISPRMTAKTLLLRMGLLSWYQLYLHLLVRGLGHHDGFSLLLLRLQKLGIVICIFVDSFPAEELVFLRRHVGDREVTILIRRYGSRQI